MLPTSGTRTSHSGTGTPLSCARPSHSVMVRASRPISTMMIVNGTRTASPVRTVNSAGAGPRRPRGPRASTYRRYKGHTETAISTAQTSATT
jgi:hypothetical protein